MDATQDTAARAVVIVLGEVGISPHFGELPRIPYLHQKAALVAKHPRLDEQYIGESGRRYLHWSPVFHLKPPYEIFYIKYFYAMASYFARVTHDSNALWITPDAEARGKCPPDDCKTNTDN